MSYKFSTYGSAFNKTYDPYGVGMSNGRNGRHAMYGNPQGLPGLPQSRYMPLGGHKSPRPPPRLPGPRPPPPQPPMMSNLPPQPSMPQPDPMVGRRIDMLEQRLNATEQSNRTLLDEMMRLQQELKMNVKKNEMGLVEEKEGRSRLDAAIRQSQNKTYEMEDRIRRCEDGLKENRNAIQQMTSHTKSIEMALKSAEQDQMERRGNSAQRLQEYRHEVMKMNQSKEQLERLVYSMRDEMRDATTRVEGLTQELNSLEANVKMQGRLMEESNSRRNTPQLTIPKTPVQDTGKMSEGVRLALEGKMIQMNTLIQDLTQRINAEAKKREKVETDVNIRINELLEDYGSTKVEKDKEMREFDDKMKEIQAGFSASEKQRILMEISSVAQELNTKIDQKEVKLRDDTVNKLTVIEKTLNEENRRRAAKEKELQESVDKQMKEASMRENEGTAALKKHMEQHETQVRNKLGEMTNTINSLEDDMKQHRLEQEKVIASEIVQRQNENKIIEAKIDDLEDRQRRGMASLQAAVGDVASKNTGKKTPDYDEIQRLQNENADGIREQVAKDVAKIENRLGTVETKVQQQEKRMDNKLESAKAQDKEANSIMGDKMQQQIDSVIFSQERLKKQVDSLQNKVQDTPKSVTNLKDEMEDMEKRLSKKVDQERKERMDDVAELRADVDKIIGKNESAGSVPSLARLNQDIDETQTGMKKLAEAVHVVKTSLSERIKDERKIRAQEDTILKRDVERLNTKYTDLKDKIRSSGGSSS
ncbi:dynactin subunit 1-like isoform X1 [Penaeus japonicus]|uniref:dynactin subunit 1-like isoform X1 n=2 Tax=Penaeus japonicus TaxID=27405 RepID=UPI001C712A69|nr:dynactin subunit 1-like isoform X1 [Penaeus japonicus]